MECVRKGETIVYEAICPLCHAIFESDGSSLEVYSMEDGRTWPDKGIVRTFRSIRCSECYGGFMHFKRKDKMENNE